jgi:hypothetical protein
MSMLIVLIPFWIVLYLVSILGAGAIFLWEKLYYSVYERAGSPLDK